MRRAWEALQTGLTPFASCSGRATPCRKHSTNCSCKFAIFFSHLRPGREVPVDHQKAADAVRRGSGPTRAAATSLLGLLPYRDFLPSSPPSRSEKAGHAMKNTKLWATIALLLLFA